MGKWLSVSTDINFDLYLMVFWREEQVLSIYEQGQSKSIQVYRLGLNEVYLMDNHLKLSWNQENHVI